MAEKVAVELVQILKNPADRYQRKLRCAVTGFLAMDDHEGRLVPDWYPNLTWNLLPLFLLACRATRAWMTRVQYLTY